MPIRARRLETRGRAWHAAQSQFCSSQSVQDARMLCVHVSCFGVYLCVSVSMWVEERQTGRHTKYYDTLTPPIGRSSASRRVSMRKFQKSPNMSPPSRAGKAGDRWDELTVARNPMVKHWLPQMAVCLVGLMFQHTRCADESPLLLLLCCCAAKYSNLPACQHLLNRSNATFPVSICSPPPMRSRANRSRSPRFPNLGASM